MLVAGLVAPTVGVVRLAPGVRSVVFQEAFLLGGTVADNVAWAPTTPTTSSGRRCDRQRPPSSCSGFRSGSTPWSASAA